ncbi:PepSY-associated TM helix domain-containing protein [Chryseobacterium wangxinyae]|uniref:PepSY-associated TM helix domain-containing protein n=1 Tax=Chryseobacterium sp. CY350 TaxID=2997336 RepID=UPI002271CE81|nr:PepSY-associated TM helix domain-containing protein [Chryseobacterium sp. CY350]MCY0976197.1 PepSY-associated TM helix domain-containing protein [Chryseobacterium sp. CY350]WBZ94205.1 PepSY-associated TM helix domain-containing protein [Chryseobacterium sp. CY350]
MRKKHHHKKKPSFFKKWTGKLHLWFGLGIGFLIFIISITGALYVFKDEVENFTRKDVIYHNEKNIDQKQILPIRILEKKVVDQVHEEYPIHWVNIPIDKKMSYQFYWYEHNPKAWHYFEEFPIYKLAYVNPYTGKVLRTYDEKNGFFQIVKMIHWSYLLKQEWGTYVVGIPVIIFVIMLISGIILWWPKNKAARKQRFSFKWQNVKNWKRKNYDLHNILGFYASIFALVFSLTGLFYAFFVVQAAFYFVFSGGSTTYPDFSAIKTKAPTELRTEDTLDKISNTVKEKYPTSYGFAIDLGHPHIDDHEHPNFEVFVKHLSYSYHKSSSLIFDENSGELLHTHDMKDKNFGEKAVGANYDIHVGSILGLPTKIIAFIVSLICASLPVTGFLVWWGRRKKTKKAV